MAKVALGFVAFVCAVLLVGAVGAAVHSHGTVDSYSVGFALGFGLSAAVPLGAIVLLLWLLLRKARRAGADRRV